MQFSQNCNLFFSLTLSLDVPVLPDVPVGKQMLYFRQKIMDDTKTLRDSKIVAGEGGNELSLTVYDVTIDPDVDLPFVGKRTRAVHYRCVHLTNVRSSSCWALITVSIHTVNRESKCDRTLVLENHSSCHVAWKVMTTSPGHYGVQPACATLAPFAKAEVKSRGRGSRSCTFPVASPSILPPLPLSQSLCTGGTCCTKKMRRVTLVSLKMLGSQNSWHPKTNFRSRQSDCHRRKRTVTLRLYSQRQQVTSSVKLAIQFKSAKLCVALFTQAVTMLRLYG